MKCNDSRVCFSKFRNGDHYVCDCLSGKKQYKDGECPFCKTDGCVTNGHDYAEAERRKR